MLGMRCHVIDALDQAGGQVRGALSGKADLRTSPSHPRVEAAALIELLAEQAAPFAPVYRLGRPGRVDRALAHGGFVGGDGGGRVVAGGGDRRRRGSVVLGLNSAAGAGFMVSAMLLAAATAAALVLLREDGRGQRVNLIELQTAGA